MSAVGATPYTMVLGLGANGSTGVKSTTGPTSDWPQILTGEGGPVAIDPANPNNWYVNNGAGVSIYLCSQAAACNPEDFGTTPVISNAEVNGDGLTMFWPAPFLVDPADTSQLLIGTCRIWRGPANGAGWSASNAISPMFDGNRTSSYCHGNALVRTLSAMPLPGGGEIVYAGTYGVLDGGATLPGHVFSATLDAHGIWSTWQDLTLNPVVNDQRSMNSFGMGISSISIDAHDLAGKTVYVTIEGVPNPQQAIIMVYRSTDGGAHWYKIQSDLPLSAANALVIDPQDGNTAYIATDGGVYITRDVASCATIACWSAFGGGLPGAPVVALSAAPPTTSPNVLVAGTFGRGVWQIPLATAGVQATTASIVPGSLDFGSQGFGIPSPPQTVTVTNTGGVALQPGSISISGDFSETDNCAGATLNTGQSCTFQVTFTPSKAGLRSGQLYIAANIPAGTLNVALSGTGQTPGAITLTPLKIDFGLVKAGSTSSPLPVTAENSGQTAVGISSITIAGPFLLAMNSCGTTSFGSGSDCQLQVAFAPKVAGPASGLLTILDDAGTQVVQLIGTGASPPTDTLSSTALTFVPTIIGQTSAAQSVTLTNSGDLPLTSIAATIGGPFQLKNDCTAQLVAHSSCSLGVSFTPIQSGTQTGSLTIADAVNPGQTVTLSGSGLMPPVFSVSPTSLVFPSQAVGVASSPATLKVTNSGGAAMSNVGFQITGPAAADFSTGATNCGASLDVGASCSVQVIFTPGSNGGASATLTISSSTTGTNPVTVALSGSGQSGPGLNVSPTQLSFSPQGLNIASPAQTVTVSNTAAIALTGMTLAVSGPFSLVQNTCGAQLAAGANCTTGVVFTPLSRGALSGVLTASTGNANTPATVSLSGIGGLTGAVQITPSLLNFPMTGVGSASSAVTVTIANSGAGIELDNLHLSVSSGFRLGNTTCGQLLAAGGSCTAEIAFAPVTAGAQTGTVTLTSDQLAAAANVPLSGVGFDFQVATSGGTSQTVSSGQTASYLLSLVNPSGSTATFSLQCGSLPAYATCVFSPTSSTVGANATGSVSLHISTGLASSALGPAVVGWWQMGPPLLVIVSLPILRRGRRRVLLSFVALAFILATGLTACSSSGGGGGGSPPPPATHTTPVGTYSIPVLVSSTGVQHTVTLTLVVD
jgi:hypothetical protein